MDASEVTEVCRLCPVNSAKLISVFDERFSGKNNMKEVILVTTGIEVKHSQKASAKPLEVWCIVSKEGYVSAAHCTCMAGNSEVSSHVGAILFAAEYANKKKEDVSCTDTLGTWMMPSTSAKLPLVPVLENDEISVKICDRCCNITLRMFKFRQDAILQDKSLRERRNQLIGDRETRLPNTDVRIKREVPSASSAKTAKRDLDVHHSITQMYKVFPTLKMPRICMNRDMSPFVSLPMGDVEKYFEKRKLNINEYIWKSPPTSIKNLSNRVAKKRVSVPTEQNKTVTPLKISKKLCTPHEKSNKTSESYFCTPVNEERKRKRSLSCDSGVEAKLSRESNTGRSNNISEVPVTPSRVTIPSVNHTIPVVDQCEDSGDSATTTATSSSSNTEAYQHDYLESFGLTPTVTTMKSQPQLVCHLCGSVHNNASELKRHTMKHMVCQFCKRRFKSLENKNHHVNNICEIRKVMTSTGPKVYLTKIDLDLGIRKKYMDAFTKFEPIPGLMKSEEVVVRAASPPQTVHQYNIIVLSDDDDGNADPLSATSTAAGIISSVNNISNPSTEFNSSIIRPDIKLKTDDIISDFFGNNNEKEVMKGLLRRCNAVKIAVEKMIQTDMPASKDIKIQPDASCEFKNLKDHIVPFKVPIHLINGAFNVAYKFDNPPKSANKFGAWHRLPIVDVRKKSPNTQAVVANSKSFASSSASTQQPVSVENNNPQPSTSQSNNVQDVNSPTPMLQTYFDRTPNAGVPSKSLPIPKNYHAKKSSGALKTTLAANTPLSQSLNKHIGPKNSGNPMNNTTNQLPPNTILGEILDRTPTSASLNISEEIASNMENLLSNIPYSNSPANNLKNSIPHPTVSTNQVFVNNTTIPNNSTIQVQYNVVPMSNGRTSNNQMNNTTNTTTLLNNPVVIQNIPVLSLNQQKNGIYSPLVTSNTATNVYTSPLTLPNTQRNLNDPASLMPNAITNANPLPLLTPNKQRNVNPTVLTAQNNTQRSVRYIRSAKQNTRKNVYPPASAKLNIQRNVNRPTSTTQNTQGNANSPALATQNTQMNVNSPTLATQNTQGQVPLLVPHRNALLMPNTQRNSTYSVEPARFRVKDIKELL